jgi:hypothetical protein
VFPRLERFRGFFDRAIASSLVALLNRPTTCVRFAGLMLREVAGGDSFAADDERILAPELLLTFSSASRIACAFSSLVKSVNGSLRNSAGISTPD